MKVMTIDAAVKRFAIGLAASAALLAGSARAATLTWNLAGGGNWDTATANWTGDATTFVSNGSQGVIFNKTGGGTIVVSAGMQPASTTVSASSGTYTFNGGAIAGAGGLTKSGGGTLTLSNTNSYTGKTIVQGGTLATVLGANYLSNAGVPGVFGAPTGPDATIDLHNGVVLQNNGSNPRLNQATDRPLNLAGTGPGTVTIRFNDNDTSLTFGAVTATGTGAKTLDLYTGYNGNGDREAMIFTGAISDSSDGSPTSLRVNFRTQTTSNSWVSLSGVNTFTGPITLVQGSGPPTGYLVIGGVRAPQSGANTVGTGTLGNGNYPGAITLATGTILEYDSTSAQTLAGVISGPGALQVTGSGTLTLSAANTYTGNTTVSSGGKLTLGSTTGGLKFVVTDTANNKVTGAGTATMNGIFTIDTSAVTVTSGSWTLVNTTTKSFGSSFSVSGFEDTDLDNVWTKLDGARKWTFSEASGELRLGTVAEFTSFGLPDNPAIIDNTAKTIQLFVPVGTNMAALAPGFTVSSGTCNQTSDSPPSPTFAVQNPATYTITDAATEPDTVNSYAVSVQTYETWAHSGSIFILTTPEGANLPAGAAETNFPLLLRLNATNFDFTEAQADGRDIRFITAAGANLSYQIEHWDAVAGTASVWVKIPTITGNSRQEIKMYWGKPDAPSQSSGPNVFNSANGYVSVYHLGDTLTDEVGTTAPANSGTSATSGLIGKARNFTAGSGVNCGTSITGYPTGSNPHSSQAWFRATAANNTILAWGIEQGQGKVVMQLANPPHMNMDCYFGGANVTGAGTVPLAQWVHVVHTYQSGSAKIYVNGVLDGTNTSGTMNIPTPGRMYIGGWWDSYSYAGTMDEVRISNVTRSANWVKLEYENQKPLQTLLGTLVQPGSTFSVDPTSLAIDENAGATLTAQAGGAQKVSWILKQGGVDTVLAVDQLTLNVSAGRVSGDQSYVIQFKGVYPSEIKTIDVPVTITETVPDPVFTLSGPDTWNGRDTIQVTPNISNLAAMQAAGAGMLNYSWSVNGVAVIKQITTGVLTLYRSQGSGAMTVSLTIDNGGAPVTATKTITVQEPASDAWVQRTPGATEKPVNNQFFARDPNTNMGTIHYNGTGAGTNPVYLKIFATPNGGVEAQYGATLRQTPSAGAYSFAVPIAAGKVAYRVEFGTTTGGVDGPASATATNLICGDAFIIEGQSNALATDNTEESAPAPSSWIRSYGKTVGWGNAVNKGSELQLGVWGIILAQRLLADNNIPVCIINGAVGGTRIDQHRPNPAGHGTAGSLYSIYADLYNRIVGAKLTHGIRAVMWHQGEQDQGSGGPDGDYDYKFYQQYFVDISAAWKADFPNILNYYIFQIWPAACGDTSRNDQLREVQRTLPGLYSNMRIMSTVGIVPGSGCHYVLAGYQVFSDLLAPMLQQDIDNYMPASVFSAPNLTKAYFTTATQNEIALEFDQNMAPWIDATKNLFFLDGVAGKVASGTKTGNVVKLQLTAASTATTLTYLKGIGWDGVQGNLLYGSNGKAALTFADVVIEPPPTPYESWAANAAQGLTAGVNDGPMDDPDKDDIPNLMEFALAGNPMAGSQAILPDLTKVGGTWFFEYDRNDASLPPATIQQVEYGSDLTGWTAVTIPATTAAPVTITPGSPSDHVKVTIPTPGDSVFVRLKVTQP